MPEAQLTSDEVRQLLSFVLRTARRYGYRLDDDAKGVIGLAVARALSKWDSTRGASVKSYAIKLSLRALAFRPSPTIEQFNELLYVLHPRRDTAQRLLLELPEPDCFIAHGAFIERLPIYTLCLDYNSTPFKINAVLQRVAATIRRQLRDEL